jgi:cobalt-zinc-cadmium efflux system outer membrane protein
VIQAALLVEQALINRPDLRAAELLVEQEATRAGLAKLEALRIAGLLRSNNDTAAIGGAGINFAPGIQFDIPIFDWGQGQSAAVTARLDRAARRCWTIREQISLQVHEACLQAAYARQNLRQWRNHLEPAIRHSMDVAQRAFERGNMNKLTVLQQGLALVDAQDQTRQAATALRNATTQLEWSVARNLATETAK